MLHTDSIPQQHVPGAREYIYQEMAQEARREYPNDFEGRLSRRPVTLYNDTQRRALIVHIDGLPTEALPITGDNSADHKTPIQLQWEFRRFHPTVPRLPPRIVQAW